MVALVAQLVEYRAGKLMVMDFNLIGSSEDFFPLLAQTVDLIVFHK